MADIETVELTLKEFRLQLGERVPDEGEPQDTNFTDDELKLILTRCGGNYYLALAEGWSAKAAAYVELIDVNEDGSDRKLSQMYTHAQRQFQRYDLLAKQFAEVLLTEVGALAVGAKGFDAWGATEDAHTMSVFNSDDTYIGVWSVQRFSRIW